MSVCVCEMHSIDFSEEEGWTKKGYIRHITTRVFPFDTCLFK